MNFEVEYGFFVVEIGELPSDKPREDYILSPSKHQRLILAEAGLVTVSTGWPNGQVQVDIDFLEHNPGRPVLESGQEMQEISIRPFGTDIVLTSPGSIETPDTVIGSSPSGFYRFRCIATGRERDNEDSVEKYRIEIWPTFGVEAEVLDNIRDMY